MIKETIILILKWVIIPSRELMFGFISSEDLMFATFACIIWFFRIMHLTHQFV